ncbi:hypothetical protein TNCV_2392761 [Trichonephila clavipes]|nr:hypothetical protein TNCV_2392761 [Trichonephila clavipes]
MCSAFAAWDILHSCRTASSLMRLVEGEERWESPDHPHDVLPQNWGLIEQNHIVACVVLKATANDRRLYSPLPQ